MMSIDNIIVGIIVVLAAAYFIYYLYKKVRSINKVGPCGHECENCPFAKYNQGTACCHTKPTEKK